MQINDDNFEEILASYIDGVASDDQTAQINQLMSGDVALFRDVTMAIKATCMIEICAERKEDVEPDFKNENTQREGQSRRANYANTKYADFTEAVEYTERNQGVLERYPEIKLQRFFPEALNKTKMKSFANTWVFGLPLASAFALFALEQILRNLRLYKSYYFDTIMIILFCASVVTIVVFMALHSNKVAKRARELESDIDYIENKNKRMLRIVKDGKFGLLDTHKLNIVLPPAFDYIGDFKQGRAKATRGNIETYIDQNSGKEII